MEWTPDLIMSAGGEPLEVLSNLRRRDFVVFEIREPSLDLTPVTDAWIALSREPEFFANLLCVPSKRLNVLELLN
jgi:hypothetical protein